MSSILNHQGAGGSDFRFPTRTISRAPGQSVDVHAPTLFQAWPNWYWYYEDFLYDTLPSDVPFTVYDHSPSGSPTKAIVANATGGIFQLLCTSTSEAQTLSLTLNDNLLVQGNLPFLFAARVSTVHTMAANQTVVVGLGSALNTNPVTFDYVTYNAWLRQTGNATLLVEVDDNVTDQSISTGETITAASYYWYFVERGTNGKLYLGIQRADGSMNTWDVSRMPGGSDPAFTSSAMLQPMVAVAKASGTTTPQILIDAVLFGGARS